MTRTGQLASAPRNGAWFGWKPMSPPPSVRTTTKSASPSNRICSGETSSTAIDIRRSAAGASRAQLLRLRERRLRATDVEERLLGQVVELTAAERLEAVDRLGDRHEDALEAGEHLADEER